MLIPKLFDTLKDYSAEKFSKDATAGLIVGIVSLPLAIAFAIASGATPDKGLYTAIIAGFIISAFGGSRVQIGGPTGAFVIIVYRIIQQYGYNGLLLSTIIAGIILVIFGLCQLGSIIKFIPYSVITGFTFGIAVLIFIGQIPDFMGLALTNLPADAIEKMSMMGRNLDKFNVYAFGLAAFTLLTIWLSGKVTKRIPGSLLAILLASAAAYFFGFPVETIGSRFGQLPTSLPHPALPVFDFNAIRGLLSPAFTIAMLGAIESLLSAVVADGMIGSRHDSNMELVAQGAANIISPLFGGLPATGAIARTATNIKNGGRTPVAGLISSFTLLMIVLLLGGLVSHIPLACLAGILMSVAYHMSEWRSVLATVRLSRGAAAVTLVTLGLTILVNLTVAIEIGMILATMAFIRGMSAASNVKMIKALQAEDGGAETDFDEDEKFSALLPEKAMLYEISGPMFFGAIYKFKEALEEISRPPAVIILKLTHVPFIDSTGVNALKEALKIFARSGTKFIFCGVQPQVMTRLLQGGISETVGRESFYKELKTAVDHARKLC
ncbi:MAG: SulP family inorganic anion transporter [Elusimicrobiales bacterium]|nr:SulP family inorganic anion transporter [Elusimicrobiales bacterium]